MPIRRTPRKKEAAKPTPVPVAPPKPEPAPPKPAQTAEQVDADYRAKRVSRFGQP